MYQAFELTKNDKLTKKNFPEPFKIGKLQFDMDQNFINSKLEEFLLPNGNFDASAMKENWFPQIKADIFLSHAHADEDLAMIIAGILNRDFGLKVFIDSCVWGDSNKLLKKIDYEICYDKKRKVYEYDKRNYTTTHVHIMLASALNEMIYNTEAVFFLNTHRSAKVNTKDLVKKTESGWIYSEIKMCELVQRRLPNEHESRLNRRTILMSKGGRVTEAQHSFEWTLDTSSFTQLEWNDIKTWKGELVEGVHPLDILYQQHKILKG